MALEAPSIDNLDLIRKYANTLLNAGTPMHFDLKALESAVEAGGGHVSGGPEKQLLKVVCKEILDNGQETFVRRWRAKKLLELIDKDTKQKEDVSFCWMMQNRQNPLHTSAVIWNAVTCDKLTQQISIGGLCLHHPSLSMLTHVILMYNAVRSRKVVPGSRLTDRFFLQEKRNRFVKKVNNANSVRSNKQSGAHTQR